MVGLTMNNEDVRMGGAEAAVKKPGLIERLARWFDRCLLTKRGFVLLYSLLFAVVATAIVVTCLLAGKSLIWTIDGLWQQYAWFVYAGTWVRDLFANLLAGGGFEPLMWEMNSGYGVDVIQSIAGIFLNPMFAIAVFVPQQAAEFAFELAMFATLYVAGLVFALWCTRGGKADRASLLVGTLTYVFAGNSLVMFYQPSFLIMLVAFPLVLISADMLFERRSPLPYVLVLAWCFACSYYDSYMVAILLVLYCLQKFWFEVRPVCSKKPAVVFAKLVGRFAGYTVIALLLSGFLMLPQVMALFGMSRLDLERSYDLLYGIRWYLSFIVSYFGSGYLMGADSFTGFNALVPLVLVALVVLRRRYPALAVSAAVLTAMLVLPVFGSAMNGFEYPANRWSWAYALCVSAAVVYVLPSVALLTARQRRVVAAVVCTCGAVFVLLPLTGIAKSFGAEFVLAVALIVLVLRSDGVSYLAGKRFVAVCACVVASLVVGIAGYLSPFGGGHAYNLTGFGKVGAFHTALNTTALVEEATANGTYDATQRLDHTAFDGSMMFNSSLVTGTMGANFYNSIYSSDVDDFNASLGLTSTHGTHHMYDSLASRTSLDTILGVRYFAASDAQAGLLPYTYRSGTALAQGVLREGKHYALYETEQSLPLAFAYTAYIPRSTYDALSQVNRQAALMQAVVLPNEDVADARVPDASANLVLDAVELPFEVAGATGCELTDDGSVLVRSSGAVLTLRFEGVPNSETYLCVTSLAYRDISLRDRYTADQWEALGFINRNITMAEDALRTPVETSIPTVWSQGGQTQVWIVGPNDHIYGDKEDYAVNLGYSETGVTELTVTFPHPGVYSFDSVSVQAQPMDAFDAQYEALAANAATNVVLGRNQIACSIDVDEPVELFFSVAYSAGWSATVDGEPASILKANVGFMAVPLEAGTHEVVLTYETPYLREGCLLSVVGLVVLACVLVVRRGLRSRAGRQEACGSVASAPVAPSDAPKSLANE